MRFLSLASPVRPTATGLAADLSEGLTLAVDALERWCLRVAITPRAGPRVDRTWMIAPGGDVPWEGAARLGTAGFACPTPAATFGASESVLHAGDFILTLAGAPLRLSLARADGTPLLSDSATGAYALARAGSVLRHYQARGGEDRHYGLGDKTGPLDRSGRRARFVQLDALAYNAETSDPLYKHAPFLIVDTAERGAVGLVYDSMSELTFDLGCEHSNYHPAYRYVEALDDSLVYYVIAGPQVRDVVPRLMQLIGRPHLPPRWSFGFAFTSMHHADAPNAQAVMTGFAERCRAEDIPISAIHSGSGYTTGPDGRRYVFTWNTSKFPDRAAFFARLGELGYRTAANVKPVLLTEHPAYAEAAAEGRFVKRADGSPAVEMFWGGPGSSLDFTKSATVAWWKDGITHQVLDTGFTAAWNDNNEAEIFDEGATVAGFGKPMPAIDVRPLQALLMTRATFEATQARQPDVRPYTITRAGPLGLQRYAETWSGDNATSWHTLKWNIRNGLSMSLSGWPFVGHDIGGFWGPKPDPELFVRWLQMMALHPRAVMNSWKPQEAEPTNTPFMHPSVMAEVKAALSIRYRFLPLMYHLAWRAHSAGEPIIAPTFYHFDDPALREDCDLFMLGADVLVAPVVHPDARGVPVRLPAGARWVDFWTGQTHEAGLTEIAAPLERLPILVREGAVLPLAAAWPAHAPHDAAHVELTLFAGDGAGEATREVFFDDGESWAVRARDASLIAIDARWSGVNALLTCHERWTGRGRPALTAAWRGQAGSQVALAGLAGADPGT